MIWPIRFMSGTIARRKLVSIVIAFVAIKLVCIPDSLAIAQHAPITAIAFTPNGRSVVACSQSGVQTFGWPELKLQKTAKVAIPNLNAIAFSPDGSRLAIGGGSPADEGVVAILAWPTGQLLMTLSGHRDSVTSLAWLGNTTLVSSGLDRIVIRWDLATQKTVATFLGHSRGVGDVCILDDGPLVSAGHDHSLRVWNAESGELIRSLNQHTKPVNALAIRPESAGLPVVASAAGDRTIRFWQPTIGRMMRSIRMESEPLDIAWVNEKLILASCVDGQARLIDADQVKVIATMPGIEGWAYAIACHPGDQSIAIAGSDGQIRRLVIDPDSN